jgi:hypothetical protein
VQNTKINHRRTELCNISRFGNICFLFIQKWNECRFFGGTGFVCLKGVLCVLNTKIDHGQTEFPDG